MLNGSCFKCLWLIAFNILFQLLLASKISSHVVDCHKYNLLIFWFFFWMKNRTDWISLDSAIALNMVVLPIFLLLIMYIGLDPACAKWLCSQYQTTSKDQIQGMAVQCSKSEPTVLQHGGRWQLMNRRDVLGLAIVASNTLLFSFSAEAAGLPPEEKPKLCDDTCEKELENVCWGYVSPQLLCFLNSWLH